MSIIFWTAVLYIGIIVFGENRFFRFDLLNESIWDDYNINTYGNDRIKGETRSCIESLFCVKWSDMDGFSFIIESKLSPLRTLPNNAMFFINEDQCHTAKNIKICFAFTFNNNKTMDVSIYLRGKYASPTHLPTPRGRRRLPSKSKQKKSKNKKVKFKIPLRRTKSAYHKYQQVPEQEQVQVAKHKATLLTKKDAETKIDTAWKYLSITYGKNLEDLVNEWSERIYHRSKMIQAAKTHSTEINYAIDLVIGIATADFNTLVTVGISALGVGASFGVEKTVEKQVGWVQKFFKRSKSVPDTMKKKQIKKAQSADTKLKGGKSKEILKHTVTQTAKGAGTGGVIGGIGVLFPPIAPFTVVGGMTAGAIVAATKSLGEGMWAKLRATKKDIALDKECKNIMGMIDKFKVAGAIYPFEDLDFEHKKRFLFMVNWQWQKMHKKGDTLAVFADVAANNKGIAALLTELEMSQYSTAQSCPGFECICPFRIGSATKAACTCTGEELEKCQKLNSNNNNNNNNKNNNKKVSFAFPHASEFSTKAINKNKNKKANEEDFLGLGQIRKSKTTDFAKQEMYNNFENVWDENDHYYSNFEGRYNFENEWEEIDEEYDDNGYNNKYNNKKSGVYYVNHYPTDNNLAKHNESYSYFTLINVMILIIFVSICTICCICLLLMSGVGIGCYFKQILINNKQAMCITDDVDYV